MSDRRLGITNWSHELYRTDRGSWNAISHELGSLYALESEIDVIDDRDQFSTPYRNDPARKRLLTAERASKATALFAACARRAVRLSMDMLDAYPEAAEEVSCPRIRPLP